LDPSDLFRPEVAKTIEAIIEMINPELRKLSLLLHGEKYV
jgi:hypothetical protein